MNLLPSAASLSRDQRLAMAEQIRRMDDFELPDLKWFNSEPCAVHAPDLSPLCRRCGVRLRSYQRVGAAWWYIGMPAMLNDTMGLGKTATALAVLAMLKESGELGPHARAVIVCRAAAVFDPWASELARLTPGLKVIVASGTPAERLNAYMGDWEVAVVSDRTFTPARGRKNPRDGDVAVLEGFPVSTLIYDDLDALRNPSTETSLAVNRLAARCRRVMGLHATPMQKRLEEMWSELQPVGGPARLGSLQMVRSQYQPPTRHMVQVPVEPTGRIRVARWIHVDADITSDPARAAKFRAAIRPLTLRRTARDVLGSVDMPAVQYCPEFVELSPRQRERYEQLRRGTLRVLSAGGVKITCAQAGAAFTRGAQICSGLASLDDGPGADDSAKLDWVMERLTGDLAEEKVVAFVYFKANVAVLAARLEAAGIGHVLMWSAESSQRERARRLVRFREDPSCRVLVGTSTIEASLNLQVARYMLLVDTILNPARMAQLTGRCARQGSPFPTVYVHHLLARYTQEDAYLPLLRREAALADVVWNEQDSIFTALTPRQIMGLVATGQLAA